MEVAVANIEMTTLYISAAILIIAICIVMFSAWKLSRSGIDDADLAAKLEDILSDTLGDYSQMKAFYNDCQSAMVDITRDFNAAKRDVTVLENARDAQDILIQEVIEKMGKLTAQVSTITEENKRLTAQVSTVTEEKHEAYEVIHMLYDLLNDAIKTIKALKAEPPEVPRDLIIFYNRNIKGDNKNE